MEYILVISFMAVACGEAPQLKYIKTPEPQPLNVGDLDSYNCNGDGGVVDGTCATECGLSGCYQATSLNETTFPQDGFCAVFNTSRPISSGIVWYTVSGRICSSSSYPQGTGLLFNYKDQNDYEIVYKTSQSSSACYVGYVQNGVVQQKGAFECGITTANQWHRYTVTVYSNKTFEASLSIQAGSTVSGVFDTNYPMSTRGGLAIINDGTKEKLLQFDEITLRLSTDDCFSSPCQNGGICNDLDLVNGYTCICPPGYLGINCETAPRDCADIYLSNSSSNSGVYTISPTTLGGMVQVYCDMDTNGGGWTVFQRRQDGSNNFYRNWLEYERTFGNLTGEFWLGNIFISAITNQRSYMLRVELQSETESRYAEYQNFVVDGSGANYKLHVSGYTGTAGDSLINPHAEMMFTTYDRDNDAWSGNCAVTYSGAWWYNQCHWSNLNGLYLNGDHSSFADGIEWNTFTGYYYSLLRTEMKIRPVDF